MGGGLFLVLFFSLNWLWFFHFFCLCVVVNSGLYFKLEAYFKSLVSFLVHQHKSKAIKDWRLCVHVWDLLISRYHLKVIRWGPRCFVEDPNCQNLSSVQFSRSVVSDSLRPHELQHARPPCPSPSPGVHSNSRSSSQWYHPAISSSVIPFSSCP